jgi:hypothetical protein
MRRAITRASDATAQSEARVINAQRRHVGRRSARGVAGADVSGVERVARAAELLNDATACSIVRPTASSEIACETHG